MHAEATAGRTRYDAGVKRKLGITLLVLVIALCLAFLPGKGPSLVGPPTIPVDNNVDHSKTSSVTGTIRDVNGAPVAGFSTKLWDRPRIPAKLVATTVTDAQGRFEFKDISEGQYVLKGGSRVVGFIYMEVTLQGGIDTHVGVLRLAMPATPPRVTPTSRPSQ